MPDFLNVSWGVGDRVGSGVPERFVDMLETEADDEADADRIRFEAPRTSGSSLCLSRLRPRSCSAFASCSSAIPFLFIAKISMKILMVCGRIGNECSRAVRMEDQIQKTQRSEYESNRIRTSSKDPVGHHCST